MSSLILLTSCIYNIILSVPFKLLFVSDAAKNAYKNIMNDEESNYKAWKIDKMCGIKTEWARNWQPREISEVDKKICQKWLTNTKLLTLRLT